MIALIKKIASAFSDGSEPEDSFLWGSNQVFGPASRWFYHLLLTGVCFIGGTGSGKTRRLLLTLLDALLQLRSLQPENKKWAALIIDPKLSFASMFIEMAGKRGLSQTVFVLDGRTRFFRINLLKSGLPAQKIAEMLNASLFAGAPMTKSSGAAFYEKRSVALAGNLIELAQLSSDPSLKTVSNMVDALSSGQMISCARFEGKEALQRIEAFLNDDPRERKMVLSSVHNMLEPFRSAPWRAIFYEGGEFNLDVARDEGLIIVCAFSFNLTPNLSTGLYLIKQAWFTTIMARMDRQIKCNRERYCLFVADEFQQLCGRGSEADFFAVRREARGCPIVAFQQISQIRSALGDEWETVLGLLTNKIFLRNSDPDTNFYAQKLAGEVDVQTESVTQTSDYWGSAYDEKSRTLSSQTRSRVPADYLFSLPDGDALLLGDERKLYWFPSQGMSLSEEKAWRKAKWPQRPRLLPPRQYRA